MLKKFVIVLFVIVSMCGFKLYANAQNAKGTEISNDYISFILPKEVENTYTIEKDDNRIDILEKTSAQADIGGFAFGISIYKDPNEYANFDGIKKIGEILDKNGKIYDVALIRPSEIMYGEGETIKKNYEKLYDLGEKIEITGINGNTYYKNQGMKGEYLYGNLLKKYKRALEENWDWTKCDRSGLGFMYSPGNADQKTLKKLGYAFYDINSDGRDELFIGEITKGKVPGCIYDLYTIVDRRPIRVIGRGKTSSGNLYVCNSTLLCQEFTNSSNEKEFEVYTLSQNSKNLNLHTGYKYNDNTDAQKQYFEKYTSGKWKKITEAEYNQKINGYIDYKKFKYTPLSRIKN